MLQIKNLNITHKKDLRTILEDFSFVLREGDRAVIIGEEGNGKSTLLKWIVNPEWIEPYAEAAGERVCSGERLGYLPQELAAEDKQKSVYEFFCDEPLFWEQDGRELALLAGRLGLPADFFYREQRMETLSGGEKVKAQLVRLLLGQPTVLLLDEPSNDIDLETLAWLEQMILGAKQPVLYISHDEELIERTANVVIHLEQIRRKTVSRCTIARTTYAEYMARRDAQFEAQTREARNERRQEKIRQEKFRRIQQKVEQAQQNISRQDPHGGQLLKKKMKAVKSLEHRYEREAAEMTELPETEEAIFFKTGRSAALPAGKVVLDFHLDTLRASEKEREAQAFGAAKQEQEAQTFGAAKQERNMQALRVEDDREADSAHGTVLARNVSLYIRGPEKVCITGANGAGKTTLLKRIAQELLARDDIHAAYMPQNYEDLLEMDKTPAEYLAVSGDKEELTRIRTYLGAMKYTADEMEHPMAELSGGQKAKILLLKMSMSGANVLILDEPTRNFSPLSGPVIRRVLREFGGAIISISHDRKYIWEVCGRVYRLTDGGLEEVFWNRSEEKQGDR